MTFSARLMKWLRLGKPTYPILAKALIRSLVSSVAATGLFIAAVALLIISSHQVPIRSIALFLVIIELVAFLRSPLRFLDRLSAHQLGFAAVQKWRRQVSYWVTGWDSNQARELGQGEILDRALVDTEDLQELWLRTLLPAVNALLVLTLSVLTLAIVPGAKLSGVILYALLVLSGIGVIGLGTQRLASTEELVREARGRFRSVATEVARVAPSLRLLKSRKVLEDRLDQAGAWLNVVERRYELSGRIQQWALGLASFGALLLTSSHFASKSLWQAVSLLVGFSTFDLLRQLQISFASAVSLNEAMSRLEELEPTSLSASAPFPYRADIHVHDYVVGNKTHTFHIPLGTRLAVIGPSGIGKSTLLQSIAGMALPATGYVTIGGVPISAVDSDALREFVTYVPTESQYVTGYLGDLVELGRDTTRDFESDFASLGLDWNSRTELVNPSRGERSRLAVVRAIATSPAIVVLDEPTSGLGDKETKQLLDLLSTCDSTFVVATHDPLVMDWCQQRIQL